MSPSQVQEALDDTETPNAPARLKGGGLSGSRAYVDPKQARERRAAMSAALMAGASRDAIMATFTDPTKFGLSEQQVQHLMQEVRAMWDEEDVDAVRYARGAARRRILAALSEARKDRKWTAYFNGEKTLAEIEGTVVPEGGGQISDAESRFTEAVLAQLGSRDPGELRVLIERERMLIEVTPTSGATKTKARVVLGGG